MAHKKFLVIGIPLLIILIFVAFIGISLSKKTRTANFAWHTHILRGQKRPFRACLMQSLRLQKKTALQSRRITTFEDCAAAGYPVMQSYPEQCSTPDGKHFVKLTSPIPSLSQPSSTPRISPTPIGTTQQGLCTQEAKQCPDGSYVIRQGQNCDFAPCPGAP